MKKIILLPVILLYSIVSNGQSRKDVLGVSTTYYLPSNLQENQLNSLEMDYSQINIYGKIPIINKDKTKFILAPSYDLKSFTYDKFNIRENDIRPDNLHDIRLGIVLKKKVSTKWSYILSITPGLSSEFNEGINEGDVLYRSAVIASYRVRDNFNLGLGLMSSYIFGESQVLPIVSIDYTSKNEKLNLDIVLPRLTGTYAISKKLKVGFEFNSDGSQYNYRDIMFADTTYTDYLRFSQTNISPLIEYYPKGNLVMRLKAGKSVNRTADLYDDGNNSIVDISPEDAYFFQFGVALKLN